MIKPEDLRIGNIIHYKGNYSNYKGIAPLTKHLFSYLLEVDDEWDLIDPIPLNEEWLFKFENLYFSKYGEVIFKNIDYEDMTSVIFENKNKKFYYTGGEGVMLSPEIEFLHQFQNYGYLLSNGRELKLKI